MRLDSKLYKEWLNIDLEPGQFPDDYAILGLKFGEPDLSVIEEAVERQFTRLRNVDAGTYFDEFREVLKQLETARCNLMIPGRKPPQVSAQPAVSEKSKSAASSKPVKQVFNHLHFETWQAKIFFFAGCVLAFTLGLFICIYMIHSSPRDQNGRVIFTSARKKETVVTPPYTARPEFSDNVSRPNPAVLVQKLPANLAMGEKDIFPAEPEKIKEPPAVGAQMASLPPTHDPDEMVSGAELSEEPSVQDITPPMRKNPGRNGGFAAVKKNRTQKNDDEPSSEEHPSISPKPVISDHPEEISSNVNTLVDPPKKAISEGLTDFPKPKSTSEGGHAVTPFPAENPYDNAVSYQRIPVPGPQQVAEIKQSLQRDYIQNMLSQQEKKEFAKTLYAQAATDEMDPVERYAYLDSALTIFCKSIDTSAAMQTLSLMKYYYDIDSSASEGQVLLRIAGILQGALPSQKNIGLIQDFVSTAESACQNFVRDERFDLASQLSDIAYNICSAEKLPSQVRTRIFRLKMDMNTRWENAQISQESKGEMAREQEYPVVNR